MSLESPPLVRSGIFLFFRASQGLSSSFVAASSLPFRCREFLAPWHIEKDLGNQVNFLTPYTRVLAHYEGFGNVKSPAPSATKS